MFEVIFSIRFPVKSLARTFTFAEWRASGRRKVHDRILPESSCILTPRPWRNPASRRPSVVWAHSHACNCLDMRFSWTRSSESCTVMGIEGRNSSLNSDTRVLTCRIVCFDSCSDGSIVGPWSDWINYLIDLIQREYISIRSIQCLIRVV